MPGRYYEQWTIGDAIRHQPHRTVTETDNLLISTLTHNPQPRHLDETYAEATEFGRIVVNGTFTFALLVGLSVGDTTLGTLVANLGYDKVRMPKPVFIGDTLRAETEVIGLKDSISRPDAGIVTFAHRMFNQRDELVCTMERTALMQRRRREGPPREGRGTMRSMVEGFCARSGPSTVRLRRPVPLPVSGVFMRLRSLLFVPGDRPERMAKAMAGAADALILDLEDAVAPAAKPGARRAVRAFLDEQQASRAKPIFVRVNPLDGGMADEDLDAVLPGHPDGIVLPKAEGGGSVAELTRRLTARGNATALILAIATETPAAMFALGSYGSQPRLVGLTWGAEDLPAAIGAATSREADGRYTPPYELARSLCLFGAAAAGVQPIETVYPAFRDLEGLAAYAARGRRDGFTGMMAIHPDQVAVINAAFTPSEYGDRARARRGLGIRSEPDAGCCSWTADDRSTASCFRRNGFWLVCNKTVTKQ